MRRFILHSSYALIFSTFAALFNFCFGVKFYEEIRDISWNSISFLRKIVGIPKDDLVIESLNVSDPAVHLNLRVDHL